VQLQKFLLTPCAVLPYSERKKMLDFDKRSVNLRKSAALRQKARGRFAPVKSCECKIPAANALKLFLAFRASKTALSTERPEYPGWNDFLSRN
jgi:hypothetical protein